jgi:maleamate amidohydrolase
VGDLERDYAAAGFGVAVGFGASPAVLVVDMVRAYLDPASPLYAGVEGTVEPARRVIEAARAADVPVIYTEVVYTPGGRDGGVFFRKVRALKVFQGRGPMGQILPELAPRDGDVVVSKQYASAFFGTSLASTLTALGVDTVIVMGYSTSGCVRASAVDAMQHGFVPIVVRDACGDRDARPHEANLFDLDAKYADVVGSDEVVAYLGKQRHA